MAASTRRVQSCGMAGMSAVLAMRGSGAGIVDQLGESVDCLKWLPSGCSSDTDWRAMNASSAMRPGDRTRSAQFREQLELVGGRAHARRPGGGEGGISQRPARIRPPAHWEAVQALCRPAAPVVRQQRRQRPPPARQVPRHRHRSRAAIPRPSDPARRSTSPPSDCNRSASLSNAPNSPSSVPRFARQRDPRHKSPRSVLRRTR